jgi:hypothetical protein
MYVKRVLIISVGFIFLLSISLHAYILVLKNGRKIYLKMPFEFKKEGVYFNLPNGTLIFVKRRDIDFEATEKINLRFRKKKIEKSVTKEEPKPVEKTDDAKPKAKEETKVTPPPEIKPVDQVPEKMKIRDERVNEVKKIAEKKPEIKKPDVVEKKPPEKKVIQKRETDYGIAVESINQDDIDIDQLIKMAQSVKWIYEGKCPMCGGTGVSPLSTRTNKIICTYCNGTGKGGKWNDGILKIGDDCPWCILGYDELAKSPCRHCMGTGRYLGLDRLQLFSEGEEVQSSNDEGIKRKEGKK